MLRIIEPEYLINADGVVVVVIRNWLNQNASTNLHSRLHQNIPWILGQMNFYGKVVDIPRGMFFLGDNNITKYSYSRVTFPVVDWESNPLYKEIQRIRDMIKDDKTINSILGTQLNYNSCLLNNYRDGNDKIDFHSDREALGPMNAVVTLSLGASREFVFKYKTKGDDGRYPRIDTILNNGDLVIMAGRCQELWTHGIPKQNNVGPRISLTYRLI